MKRLLILFLALSMVFCVAACSTDPGDTSSAATSQATSSTSASESKVEESTATSSAVSEAASEAVSEDESSVAPDESSEAGTDSEDTPSEDEPVSEGGDKLEVAAFISQYISWSPTTTIGHGGLVAVRSTDVTSAKLTAINVGVVDNLASAVAFNSDYGKTIESDDGSYDDYEVFVFEYDHSIFNYTMTEKYGLDADDKDLIEIPDDGFVVAIHKEFSDILKKVNSAPEGSKFYPHGFRATNDLDVTIKNVTPHIDGTIGKNEYGNPVWEIEPTNELCSYEQFEDNNYYSTAKVYLTYDADNLYIAVLVDSPYHVNTCTEANKTGMYNFECIQVNVTSADPTGEYVMQHWDNIIDATAANANIVRQLGFCVNDNDETLYCIWMPGTGIFNGEVVCTRDDNSQLTTYEAAIPWSDLGSGDMKIDPKKGTVLGVSVSINSGSSSFKNIFLRDGGGIIGLNDWTKVPTITLG